jgi:uncharacterized SAM-binding protein YcdF (DUF218 family)
VFYLSKILPIFVLPTGVTILLVAAGLILRRAALCWAGVAVLFLAATPFVSGKAMRAAEGWQVRQTVSTAPSAHAIVVLSHGRIQPPGQAGISEWVDADRFYGGVDLYKAGKAPLLIFTGGWSPWQPDAEPEGDVLIRYALDLGIPREKMLATAKVSNTEEEARAVAAMLAKRPGGGSRILLVTSAFHMRRAQMVFVHAGLDAVPFPVDFNAPSGNSLSLLGFLPNAQSLSRTETALREFYGLLYYRLILGH